MTKERFSNLTVLNSHKERTAKFAPTPPPSTSKEVVTGPCPLKTAPQALQEAVCVACEPQTYFWSSLLS